MYPGHRRRIPGWLRDDLYARARAAIDEVGDPEVCQGTLISRFSYNIDVKEWGFRDLRKEAVIATRQLPVVVEITRSDVWDDQPMSGGNGAFPLSADAVDESALG